MLASAGAAVLVRRNCMPRKFVLSLFFSLVLALLTSYTQANRTMTIDDLITTVRVSDPQISPDGKHVLFTRTTTALDVGRRNPDIWIVPSDGSTPPRQLIGGERSENTPRFTPDGKRIVFISSRDGVPQVYVSDAEGRDVKQVTKLSGGVQGPLVVSHDSRKAASVADVHPECKDEECNERAREPAEKDPVK